VNAADLLVIHKDWAWLVVVSNGLAGLWSLAAHQWPALRKTAMWWFIGAAQLSVVVQVILGVIVVNKLKVELPKLHAFYGFVAIIAAAIVYSYRYQMKHRLYLLYGFGSLFIMGLALRAMYIGLSR